MRRLLVLCVMVLSPGCGPGTSDPPPPGDTLDDLDPSDPCDSRLIPVRDCLDALCAADEGTFCRCYEQGWDTELATCDCYSVPVATTMRGRYCGGSPVPFSCATLRAEIDAAVTQVCDR